MSGSIRNEITNTVIEASQYSLNNMKENLISHLPIPSNPFKKPGEIVNHEMKKTVPKPEIKVSPPVHKDEQEVARVDVGKGAFNITDMQVGNSGG